MALSSGGFTPPFPGGEIASPLVFLARIFAHFVGPNGVRPFGCIDQWMAARRWSVHQKAERRSALHEHATWHGHPARVKSWPGWPCHDFGCGFAALCYPVLEACWGRLSASRKRGKAFE